LTRRQLTDWIDAYERAWRTPGTEALAGLFTADATYSTGPFEDPHRGLPAIGTMWDHERTGPDEEFTMTSAIVAVEGDTGVARIEVRYGDPRHPLYRDLWIVTLDAEGRCSSFEEWPFWPPGTAGTVAGGA
jgi:hypothetical protein